MGDPQVKVYLTNFNGPLTIWLAKGIGCLTLARQRTFLPDKSLPGNSKSYFFAFGSIFLLARNS